MAENAPKQRSRLPLWGGCVVALAVFAYSWFGRRNGYVYDDAGISLRYAERIASGAGFRYNDGEAVNGASNPLFVFIEAALLYSGASPSTTILTITSVSFGAAAGVLFATFARFYSLGAAFFSVLALLAFRTPFNEVADGLETPIVGLLVTLLFRALHGTGFVLPGIALGALVANKLDGGLAAIAFTAVHLALRRSFPWRAALVAALAAAPVFLVLLATFGSVLPNSMVVKLTAHAHLPGHDVLDPWWMQRQLTGGGFASLYWAAWGSLAVLAFARRASTTFAIATMQLWFVLHMLTYATVNLGDPYPWYSAAPTFQCVILSTVLVHVVAERAAESKVWTSLARDPGRRRRLTGLASAVVLASLAALRGPTLAARVVDGARAAQLSEFTVMDLTRQAAGVWLRKHSSGVELLSSYEGLPSFEYGGPCYDGSWLNSARDDARKAAAPYSLVGPFTLVDGAALARNESGGERQLVASFRYSSTGSFHLLYARTDSEIWRSGVRHFTFPTPVLRFVGGSADGAIAVRRGATWRLPCASSAQFDFDSAARSDLLFVAALTRDGGQRALEKDELRLSVVCEGAELYSAVLRGGEAPTPVAVRALPFANSGEQRVTLRCEPIAGSDAPGLGVDVSEVLLRAGDPLRAADFKLLSPVCRDRIEHVADVGLP